MVIRLKVPIEMHYTVIPMGTSKVNSSQTCYYCSRLKLKFIEICNRHGKAGNCNQNEIENRNLQIVSKL